MEIWGPRKWPMRQQAGRRVIRTAEATQQGMTRTEHLISICSWLAVTGKQPLRQRGSRSVAIGHNKATRELLRSPGHRKLNKTKITELREKVTLIITQITTPTRPGSANGKPKLF